MATTGKEEHTTLRIVIDEAKNKVVFAEAGKDFVDVLLSYLTMPLGTIARLVAKESNIKSVSFGSLNSLHEGVANLEGKHFWTETCKEMLLHPRNSMEAYCQSMKLNIDDSEKMKYFICGNRWCNQSSSGGLLSKFRNQRCKCNRLMDMEISLSPDEDGIIRINDEGFVPKMANFIIFDDLRMMSNNIQATVLLGIIGDIRAMKEVTVNVTKDMMVDLLKFALFSETPLTDLFLGKKHFPPKAQLRSSSIDFNICDPEADVGGEIIKLKLMQRKSNGKLLFAVAEEDFVDFVVSFLTFPLGGVVKMLKCNSGLVSIDNLYKSIVDLDGCRYLTSLDLKDKLVNAKLSHQFKLQKQILPIDEKNIKP